MNQEAKIEKLVKKHEQEKSQAMQEMASLKQKMSERESKIAQEFQNKYDLVRREVDTMNKKFQERIQQFESINQDLKKQVEDASHSGSQGMEELKKKYEKELAEVIRSSNEKYNNMLVEQLQNQESIKKELEMKLLKECQSLQDKHKSELERETGQIRAKLAAEKQEALLNLRHELEDKMNAMKQENTAKLDKLLADLLLKGKENDELREKSDKRIRELEDQIAMLQKSLQDQVGGSQSAMYSLSKEMDEWKEKLKITTSKLTTQIEENETLQGFISEKNNKLANQEITIQELEDKIKKLEGELMNLTSNASQQEQLLRDKVKTYEKENESYRQEINTMGTNLMTLREDMKSKDKQYQQQLAEQYSKYDLLYTAKMKLESQVQELLSSSSSANQQAMNEIENLKKLMAEMEKRFQTKEQELQLSHDQMLSKLRSRHEEEISELKQRYDELEKTSIKKLQDLQEEMQKAQEKTERSLQRLKEDHQQKMEEQEKAHNEIVTGLKQTIDELTQQLANQSDTNQQEKEKMKADYQKLESKYKALSKEFDSKKGDNERYESITNSLKNQIENLREELKASQKAFREKLDLNSQKLEQEWADKLEAALKQAEIDKETLRKDLLNQFATEKNQLVTQHEEEIKSLKQLLQKEVNDASGMLRESERQRETLEAQLKQEKMQHDKMVQELQSSHQSAIRALEDTHRQELDRLRREYKSSNESREHLLSTQHKEEIAKWQKLLETTKQEHGELLANSLKSAQQTAEETLRQSLKDLEQSLLKQAQQQKDMMQQVYDKEKAQLIDRYEQEKSNLQNEIKELKTSLQETKNQVVTLQDIINSERMIRSRREEEFIIERDGLQREHQMALRQAQEQYEKQQMALVKRQEEESQAIRREAHDMKAQYEERIREIVKEYKNLEMKYLNRESRPEDLARIDQLTQECIEKEELVKKINEEMLYFKREMLNREENYNQKFNRQPNVGVMQVIKPKEVNDGKAKPTQMRVINTQGGNMVGGGGMGVGMGLGVGGGVGGGMGVSNSSAKVGKPTK